MRSELRHIVRFEVMRYLRDRTTWIGMTLLTLVLIIGAVDFWNSLPPRPQGSRLFGEAFLVAVSLAFHASIAHDRSTRFDWFVISNFTRARNVYFGKIVAALLFLLVIAATTFAIALVVSLGDFAYAAHYTFLYLAGLVLLFPIVVLVELAVNTRYPVPLVLALLFALIAIYSRTGDLPRALHLLGFDGQLKIGPAVVRSAVALSLTGALYPLYRLRFAVAR